jgi:hypothetical protein
MSVLTQEWWKMETFFWGISLLTAVSGVVELL